MLAVIGQEEAESFEPLIESTLSLLRAKDPLQIIATLARYGLQVRVTDDGVRSKSAMSDIEQHHVELLQALLLTLPLEAWGKGPAVPPDITAVMENVTKLAQAFHRRRFVQAENAADQQERTVLFLREMMRLRTQVVRNWGYFGDVVALSEELYRGLDAEFLAAHGFTASQLISVAHGVLKLVEARSNERFLLMTRVFRERKIPRLVRQYYKLMPGIHGDPEELIADIPPSATLRDVQSRLLAHADLSLADGLMFTPAEVAGPTGVEAEISARILRVLSLKPAVLAEANKEHLFLDNPAWTAPFVDLDGGFFCPIPQMVFSFIHDIMAGLADGAGASAKLEALRARFLEAKAEQLLRQALAGADIKPGVKWRVGDQLFETDVAGLIDRTVIVLEAKSGALTGPALRGAVPRLQRHVKDLVIDPAIQSGRLEELIWKAKAGDADAIVTLAPFAWDWAKIDTVVRLSITLEDFSVLGSSEQELREAGWLPHDVDLPPSIHVADFGCLADILDRPALFVHYLMERHRFQKVMQVLGDELDLLGFYLTTGFNLAELEAAAGQLVLSGESGPIDHYYNNRDAGIAVPKPKPRLTPWLIQTLDALGERKPQTWLQFSIDLLRMGSFEEQRQLDKALDRLRAQVRRQWRTPEHTNTLIVTPPEFREAVLVFHVYPPQLADKRKATLQSIVGDALSASGRKRCLMISRNTEAWDDPYSFVGVAYNRPP